ncbi:hypothetical protein GCM10010435_67010 [Winogradskya consettensis]|uniref:GST C-terminal domain-containing protein n=1 Tax=Winogradskya consettensis TaxID=113560 RepID=A0A919SJI0_9ACTN|nr:glutathione S-transferase C-terminal domain-containing protein [Actinoplanes consettensis]GIM73905.1 hypothetical protein Aco04nite_37750 [Actinoplanes consettensis]
MTTFASPVDLATHGEYTMPATPGPLTGRITADTAEAGRYHLYGGWFCPWSHRVAIVRTLAGLDDIVTMSFVGNERDARGWAFREQYGPDPVNGFTLLRQAYEATTPGFDGHVSVPALWDRTTGKILTNDSHAMGIDLATQFHHLAKPLIATYPAELADEIEELDRRLGPAVTYGAGKATTPGPARDTLLATFQQLDDRLAQQRYLLGDQVTEADIRLWVRLVRYDAGPNAHRTINPGLAAYPNLWAYARDLYAIPAFRDTTDFTTFTAPGAQVPDWSEPAARH